MTASTNSQGSQQLTLNVQLRDDATLDNFLCAPSLKPLVSALQTQAEPAGEPIIFLYGGEDSGKSHLLQAACHMASAGAFYLPLAELVDYSPDEVLQGMESMALVCLDDIDQVLGREQWETALFHFFNRARQNNCRLIVSACAAPRALDVGLADLQSRLSWGIVYQLPMASDEDRVNILCFRASQRGLSLPTEVATYIVNRAPRALAQLVELLATLDQASLAEQRALSIPFVKKTLDW